MIKINDLIQIEIQEGILATDGTSMPDPFSSYFTMEMSPMYASVFDVRRLIGAYILEISDDVINQLIMEISYEAEDIAKCPIDQKWLRYANKWVALSAGLTVLYNSEELRGTVGAKEFKQLGDFSVSKGGGTSNNNGVAKAIDWLECELFKYNFSVRTCRSPALNCLGLTDNSAVPYEASAAGLTEKGFNDINKPIPGRGWKTNVGGVPRGNNTLYSFGRKYKTNYRGQQDKYGRTL